MFCTCIKLGMDMAFKHTMYDWNRKWPRSTSPAPSLLNFCRIRSFFNCNKLVYYCICFRHEVSAKRKCDTLYIQIMHINSLWMTIKSLSLPKKKKTGSCQVLLEPSIRMCKYVGPFTRLMKRKYCKWCDFMALVSWNKCLGNYVPEVNTAHRESRSRRRQKK